MQQMVTCPRCGQANQLGQRFCWHCGSTLGTGCPNCGAPLDPGSRFCGNCGAQMPPQSPQQQGAWGQPPPPPQQQGAWGPPPPPPPQQPGGWGQPPPQQGAWGQPPPPQGGWGPPPPPQGAWGPPGSMPQAGAWGQPKKSAGGLWILLFVLLIGLGAFSYFAFVSENPPWGQTGGGSTASTIPITTGPFVFVKSTDAAAGKATMEMKWETKAKYKGQVEYGADTSYGSKTPLGADFTTSHVVPLPDLKMSATYNYRVILKSEDGTEWKSENSRFNTPAPASP